MPKGKTSRRRSRPAPNRLEKAIDDKLKKLVISNEMQQLRPAPEVLDVPRMRLKRGKIHSFEVTSALATISSNASIESSGAFVVSLSSLPNPSDFTTLFDQYRIIQCNIKFMPTNPGTNAATQNYIYTAIDYDDGNAIGSSVIAQYDTVQITPATQYFERTWNPRLAGAVYSGAFTSFANLSSRTWLDVASPNVQYYGLKYCFDVISPLTVVFTPILTVLLQCRQQR